MDPNEIFVRLLNAYAMLRSLDVPSCIAIDVAMMAAVTSEDDAQALIADIISDFVAESDDQAGVAFEPPF